MAREWQERMRGADIADRLLRLGSTVIAVARMLPKDVSARHVASQIIRSGTSVGANYEEARAAESRADFIHKLGIAAKEVRETLYWLKLIASTKMVSDGLEPAIREANELAAILSASIRTARTHAQS